MRAHQHICAPVFTNALDNGECILARIQPCSKCYMRERARVFDHIRTSARVVHQGFRNQKYNIRSPYEARMLATGADFHVNVSFMSGANRLLRSLDCRSRIHACKQRRKPSTVWSGQGTVRLRAIVYKVKKKSLLTSSTKGNSHSKLSRYMYVGGCALSPISPIGCATVTQ